MPKGSQFERDFCKDLSLWWTHQETDEMFWRSSNSGGRATVRARAGKTTSGQHGDIAAIHPDGMKLIDIITFELKRGYSKDTIHNVFDAPESSAVQVWESWYQQATESAHNANSETWMIVHKRDRRDVMIYFPQRFYDLLNRNTCFQNSDPYHGKYLPFIRFQTSIRMKNQTSLVDNIVMMRWDDFKVAVSPNVLRKLF